VVEAIAREKVQEFEDHYVFETYLRAKYMKAKGELVT
jgi:hypothetical protein